MHEVLEEAKEALGIELPTLADRHDRSERFLQDARTALMSEVPRQAQTEAMDIVVLGSIARREASERSDFDYLAIAHGLPVDLEIRRRLVAAADGLPSKLLLQSPGQTGMFGNVVSAADLTERIGLEQDTNVTHSRRILLLEESESIYQPELHEGLLGAILGRYLHEYSVSAAVPHFLLNDVSCYWRTIAVYYQAKRWASTQKWGLRYLKLIIPRKLTYAGTLAALFLEENASVEALLRQFRMPALARIAQLHRSVEAEVRHHIATALLVAEEFATALDDDDFRAELELITKPSDAQPGSRFDLMRQSAARLQRSLEAIFFDTELLGRKSREYLSF